MRRTGPALLVLVSALALAPCALADGKRFTVGGGVYVSTLSVSGYADDDFSGLALTGSAAFNNHFAARLNLFSTEHDDLSALESRGWDLLLLGGMNLAAPGFKVYGGLGTFRDRWELGNFTQAFSGPQLALGIGYNWSQVALDFAVAFRSASDYEDFVDDSATVSSGLLSLAFRW